MKFRYNEKVVVTGGFYRSFIGKILECKEIKEKVGSKEYPVEKLTVVYEVSLSIDRKANKYEVKTIPEEYLKKSWF